VKFVNDDSEEETSVTKKKQTCHTVNTRNFQVRDTLKTLRRRKQVVPTLDIDHSTSQTAVRRRWRDYAFLRFRRSQRRHVSGTTTLALNCAAVHGPAPDGRDWDEWVDSLHPAQAERVKHTLEYSEAHDDMVPGPYA
jgi:hypothetical protein